MTNRLFVAGATGLTGREVVRQLCSRGDQVVAHVRPDSRQLDEWKTRFASLGAEVDTSPWTDEGMKAALQKHAPDAVFALLGTTRKRGRAARAAGKDETYETVDYGLSALLLRAAVACGSSSFAERRASGAEGGASRLAVAEGDENRGQPREQKTQLKKPRFVYLSSMGVTPTTRNAYLAVRHRLESELRDSGLSWGIARPSFIGGDRDEHRLGESIGIALGDGALALVGALGGKKLREKYRSQTNVQLARALIAIADDESLGLVESDGLRELGVRAR